MVFVQSHGEYSLLSYIFLYHNIIIKDKKIKCIFVFNYLSVLPNVLRDDKLQT